MRINLYHNEAPHQKHHLQLFAEGLKRHDQSYETIQIGSRITMCDLAVFWGAHQQAIIDLQESSGNDFLVMERGYFGNRMKMTSIGYNGLNGRANFLNENSPGDRWLKHGCIWKDWKTTGDYILIMGQVIGDASIKHVDFVRWIRETSYELRLIYDLPIRCRPHPKGPKNRHSPCFQFDDISENTLAEDLKKAFMAVTFNSNSGVDAILAGVPVVACDPGSMAWPVAVHGFSERPIRPVRIQWAHDLAYCQWTELEIKDGTAWEHLKQKYE